MRRIQRIYPTYITCLLFAVWVYFYLIQTKADLPAGVIFPVPTGWSTLGNVLFLQPVFFETFPTIGPAWSLGVEALFYVLALFLVKWPRNVILFLLTASIALYVYEYSILRVYSYFGWLRPSLLLWAWLIGWLAYKNASGKLNKWSIYGLLLIPALLIHANFFTSERFAVVPCALAALAILHGDELNLSPKIAQIGNYLGELSYPLYLIHFPILFLMSCSPRPLPSLLAYPLCIGASMLVYHFVDLPLRKRRRIKKSPLQKTPLP